MVQKPRILLVNDSEITIEGLKSLLDENYEVYTAYNGFDALKELEDNGKQVDLVITDLITPIISGYALISHLKQKSPQTPIVAKPGWGQLIFVILSGIYVHIFPSP
jgi:two-component system cell cycle sensor histidine kinase/response regulator CckA